VINGRLRVFGYLCLSFMFILTNCSTSRQGATTLVPDKADPEIFYPKDSLSQQIPSEAEILPPPAPDEREYFKIQVLAAQNFAGAEAEKERLKQYTMRNIYLVKEMSLWKVQVGEFQSRSEAETELSMLRSIGWSDAWIIHYRKTTSGTGQMLQGAETPVPVQEIPETVEKMVYSVQVIATTSKKEAETLFNNIKLMDLPDISMANEDNFWKIRVGKLPDHQQAQVLLKRIKEMGFYDSWITRIKTTVKKEDIKAGDITPAVNTPVYIEAIATQDELIARNEVRKIHLLTNDETAALLKDSTWSVRLGPFTELGKAEEKLIQLINLGYRSARIIK